jgi:hypothetical protein
MLVGTELEGLERREYCICIEELEWHDNVGSRDAMYVQEEP